LAFGSIRIFAKITLPLKRTVKSLLAITEKPIEIIGVFNHSFLLIIVLTMVLTMVSIMISIMILIINSQLNFVEIPFKLGLVLWENPDKVLSQLKSVNCGQHITFSPYLLKKQA
jgi:hypothetical protein